MTVQRSSSPPRKFKLAAMDIELLRKFAKAYGLPETIKTREDLLEALNPYADGILDADRPDNLCLDPPPFTLKTIRDAIPPHCFKRSLLTSLYHTASDLVLVAALFYLALWIDSPVVPELARYVMWPVYWFVQGSVMTGVWVLAHECGHQAFSDYEWVNNLVGTVLHSFLLVPYHSWRITHGKHHNNTGSTENDEVFCPATRKSFEGHRLRETPLDNLFGIVVMLTVGWPGYLVVNVTGPGKYQGKNANHFSPYAEFFREEDRAGVIMSLGAWVAAAAALVQAFRVFGFANVAFFYFIPYLIVNYHLVLITYLQHTDVFVPHFRGKEWQWLRGALCTVDRSFGPLLDHTFHHIVDTHVCHHLFSTMPFYHAQEATQAFRKVLGPKYYLKDDTPIARALWRSYNDCQFIEDEGGIVFYKNQL